MSLEDKTSVEVTGIQTVHVVEGSGRNLLIDKTAFEIRDSEPCIAYVDLITELNHVNGTIHLSMGATSADFGNRPFVDIVTRLRMNLITAQNLRNLLDSIIADALKPTDKSSAN